MSLDQINPAHLSTYIKEAAHRLRQRFDQVETVAKSELQLMLAEISHLVAQMPDEAQAAAPAAPVTAAAPPPVIDDSTPAPAAGEPGSEPKADPADDHTWF